MRHVFSCIRFAQPDGKLIPFESDNLLYRYGCKLAGIRNSIATQFSQRRRWRCQLRWCRSLEYVYRPPTSGKKKRRFFSSPCA
jgi:hypothetical protein